MNKINISQSSTNSNYYITFKNNSETNVLFNTLDDEYYLNNTNKISTINIDGDKYKITVENNLYDMETDERKYDIYTYFNNNNNYYYSPHKELSSSLPTYFKVLNDNNMSINTIVNNIKPWEDWSMLSLYETNLSQYVNNVGIRFNGTSITKPVVENSYFTDSGTILKHFEKYLFN